MRSSGRGAVFRLKDFLDIGSGDAVGQAISRFMHNGKLQQLRRVNVRLEERRPQCESQSCDTGRVSPGIGSLKPRESAARAFFKSCCVTQYVER
jgi:hypothetical protein